MIAFNIFLSHRYESPEANLFFFQLFPKRVAIHFEVDQKKSSTNVTRLERMIRGADAFVGIYPYPDLSGAVPKVKELHNDSRYFRLELDLATRSGKPAIVFYDKRYKTVLACPPNFVACTFDSQEVSGNAASPNASLYVNQIATFCQTVQKAMAYRDVQRVPERSSRVGVLLSPDIYKKSHLASIDKILRGAGYEPLHLSWPPVLDRGMLNTAIALDWSIVDVGDPASAAAVAFLHGQFVPTLRLKRGGKDDRPSPLELTLYGGVDVGYSKDIVRWRTGPELEVGVASRVEAIDRPTKRVSKRVDAEAYFRTPSLRKEKLFLSYSGADEDIGSRVSAALKKRFEDVFDYKDGQSIRPGQPWLDEIFGRLSTAGIVVLLLSKSYFESRHCKAEARKAVELSHSRKAKMVSIIPVMLTNEKFDLPDERLRSLLNSLEYDRSFRLDNDADGLAARIDKLSKAHG